MSAQPKPPSCPSRRLGLVRRHVRVTDWNMRSCRRSTSRRRHTNSLTRARAHTHKHTHKHGRRTPSRHYVRASYLCPLYVSDMRTRQAAAMSESLTRICARVGSKSQSVGLAQICASIGSLRAAAMSESLTRTCIKAPMSLNRSFTQEFYTTTPRMPR